MVIRVLRRGPMKTYVATLIAALGLAASVAAPPVALAVAPSTGATPTGEATGTVPASESAALAAKQAQRAEALAELDQMRLALAGKVATYVSTGRRIADLRSEIVQAQADLVAMDARLVRAEQALEERAVQLYRSDRLGLAEILFGARSLSDLMVRLNYVIAAGRHDTQLIEAVQMAKQENLHQQQRLNQRVTFLTDLQKQCDEQRERIEQDIAQQQVKAAEIGVDLVAMMRGSTGGTSSGSSSGDFTPDALIAQETFRDSESMDVFAVQAFLDRQSGSLDVYRGPDHAGVNKSAAEMIVDAGRAFDVSPKVILVTLQKEQSLLSKPGSTRAMSWAMGCGKMDGGTITKYRGFGRQIWFGAKSLDANAHRFRAGKKLRIDGSDVYPVNSATHALYKYTPHFRGNMSFWLLYWRYFGDPLAAPEAR